MQRWQKTEETVLCVGVKKFTSKKERKGGKKGLMSDGCAVDSFLLDPSWTVMCARPRFLSLMACAPVMKE